MGSPWIKLEANAPLAISANSSLCLFLQPKYKAKGPIDDAYNSLNSTCLISSSHF